MSTKEALLISSSSIHPVILTVALHAVPRHHDDSASLCFHFSFHCCLTQFLDPLLVLYNPVHLTGVCLFLLLGLLTGFWSLGTLIQG